ncbi:hypothetical protein D3C86_1342700 [compost metagenome]
MAVDGRQGAAQLVGGVRHEAPLGLEALLEAVEEAVEGEGEPIDLVVGGLAHRQAAVQVLPGQAAHLGGDGGDRRQGPPREEVADAEGQGDRPQGHSELDRGHAAHGAVEGIERVGRLDPAGRPVMPQA